MEIESDLDRDATSSPAPAVVPVPAAAAADGTVSLAPQQAPLVLLDKHGQPARLTATGKRVGRPPSRSNRSTPTPPLEQSRSSSSDVAALVVPHQQEQSQKCKQCGEFKPANSFGTSKRGTPHKYCSDCRARMVSDSLRSWAI